MESLGEMISVGAPHTPDDERSRAVSARSASVSHPTRTSPDEVATGWIWRGVPFATVTTEIGLDHAPPLGLVTTRITLFSLHTATASPDGEIDSSASKPWFSGFES